MYLGLKKKKKKKCFTLLSGRSVDTRYSLYHDKLPSIMSPFTGVSTRYPQSHNDLNFPFYQFFSLSFSVNLTLSLFNIKQCHKSLRADEMNLPALLSECLNFRCQEIKTNDSHKPKSRHYSEENHVLLAQFF